MKKITAAVLGVLFAVSLVAAPAALAKKSCCNGTSCCNGQSCCRR